MAWYTPPLVSSNTCFTKRPACYFNANSSKAAASATGVYSVAAGPAACASGASSVAMGDTAQTRGVQSSAIGANSNASHANSVALGGGFVRDRHNSVSVASIAMSGRSPMWRQAVSISMLSTWLSSKMQS
ncbi:hypothetical protein KFF47_10525 [Pseudomonas fluorescens]|nr:hypothetical protein [Pseudomonas fluorescens]